LEDFIAGNRSPKHVEEARVLLEALKRRHVEAAFAAASRANTETAWHSQKHVLAPRTKKTFTLDKGRYRVTASVDATRVRPYTGSESINYDSYEITFYISTSFAPSLPRYSPPTFKSKSR